MGIRSHFKLGMFFPMDTPSIKLLEEHYELTDSDEPLNQAAIDEFNSWSKEKQLAFMGPQYKGESLDSKKIFLYNIFSSAYVCDDTYGYLLSTPFQTSLELYDSNIVHQNYDLEFNQFSVKYLPFYTETNPHASKLELHPIPPELGQGSYYYSTDDSFYRLILKMFNLPENIIQEATPSAIITWG